ncbi:hypothetical protein M8J75_007921 [Diaphorina citri]|nr:hypothetical protein M8J75_007921 [Diaphorina citri]
MQFSTNYADFQRRFGVPSIYYRLNQIISLVKVKRFNPESMTVYRQRNNTQTKKKKKKKEEEEEDEEKKKTR